MSCEGLFQAARLLGYWFHRMIANYAYLADAHPIEAAEQVGTSLPTR